MLLPASRVSALIAIFLLWPPLSVQGYPADSIKGPELLSLFPLGGQRGTTLTLYEPAGSWFDPNRIRELAFHLGRLATPATLHTFDRMPNYEKPRLTYRFSRKGYYLIQVGAHLSKGGPDCPYQFRS